MFFSKSILQRESKSKGFEHDTYQGVVKWNRQKVIQKLTSQSLLQLWKPEAISHVPWNTLNENPSYQERNWRLSLSINQSINQSPFITFSRTHTHSHLDVTEHQLNPSYNAAMGHFIRQWFCYRSVGFLWVSSTFLVRVLEGKCLRVL